MTPDTLKKILTCALLAAGEPLSVEKLRVLFENDALALDSSAVSVPMIKNALNEIAQTCADIGLLLKETASGFCFYVNPAMNPWIKRLFEKTPARYSRAFMETLAIIAYRQPITRAEIEDIRGVSISSSIFKSLLDRAWIKITGYKPLPGRPALYGTTSEFLDHFQLKSVRDLPLIVPPVKND